RVSHRQARDSRCAFRGAGRAGVDAGRDRRNASLRSADDLDRVVRVRGLPEGARMKRCRASGCLLLFALLPVSLPAADPLVAGDAPRYRLGGHLELLSDATRAMTLSQVMGGSANLKPTPDAEPNLGFSTGAAWVRFQIESQTDHTLLLVYQFANVDSVDVFVVHPDGRQEHMASGNRVPFAARPVAHRYPVFPLSLTRGQTAWCYVQLRNDDTLFPLAVWDEAAFRTADHDEQMVIGLFIGLFIIVVLSNALFYVATRDRAYLYYVMFVLSYVLFELAFRGIGGEYLWPRTTWIDDAVEVSAASLAITMGLCFAVSFLQTRIWAPIMHRFLVAFAVIGAVNTICTIVFPFTVMDEVTNL